MHFEAFSLAETHRKTDKAFQVKLARSGDVVKVSIEDPLLDPYVIAL